MHKLTAGVLGAVAVAASLLVIRQPRAETLERAPRAERIPAGETVPAEISLERLRELGI